MLYFARGPKMTFAVYEKGPKVVIQGKGIEDFILFTLEPAFLDRLLLGARRSKIPRCSKRTSVSMKAARAIFSDLLLSQASM
jgi:ribonuclease HIII